MNPGELEIMAEVEGRHWWYRGLRDALAATLRRLRPPLPPHPRVLDAGCGTGANLAFLRGLLEPAYLGGFDVSEVAVRHARRREPAAEVWVADVRDPEVRGAPLDLLLSLDVIYVPGARSALPGLRRLVGGLRPGGRLLLNLPAYDWLYSEHDVAVHTRQRFTAREVRALLDALGLSVERLSYRLCLLFPAVVLARLPRRRDPRDDRRAARSDLHGAPGPLVNRLLTGVLRAENRLIARGVRLPWGSSVFAVGRKR